MVAEDPPVILGRFLAEHAHVRGLAESSRMWATAAGIFQAVEEELSVRTKDLMGAWDDAAAHAFRDVVHECLKAVVAWRGLITSYGFPGGSLSNRIDEIVNQYPADVEQLKVISTDFENAEKDGNEHLMTVARMNASTIQERHISRYTMVSRLMRNLVAYAPEWTGPRSGRSATGVPETPAGGPVAAASAAGDPAADPGAVDPVAVDPGTVPEDPAAVPAEGPQATAALSAAAKALQAAQGLLGGTQVPDPLTPDLGDLDIPDAAYAQYAPYGQPSLAGFDAGAYGGGGAGGVGSPGGVSSGGTSLTGPGGAIGAGTPPVPNAGMAGAAAAASAAGRSAPPPMYPPNNGAANGKSGPAGIKPGNSDRPAAESRPRPRRAGPATPGVALAGRAGAAQPKPAARRNWDSDNDSLQVLDEHLWQVNPQEEETHGQDRRLTERDRHDRAADRRARDAGLVGPGRRADQSPRAR